MKIGSTCTKPSNGENHSIDISCRSISVHLWASIAQHLAMNGLLKIVRPSEHASTRARLDISMGSNGLSDKIRLRLQVFQGLITTSTERVSCSIEYWLLVLCASPCWPCCLEACARTKKFEAEIEVLERCNFTSRRRGLAGRYAIAL